MERSNKRRVARVGHHDSSDIINNIMKDMDNNIAESGNSEFYKMLKTTTCEIGLTTSNLCVTSGISNNPNKALSHTKTFKSANHHPNMKEVRKNMNHIKHNRSVPKPRAHLGGLRDEKTQREDTKRTDALLLKKSKRISSKNTHNTSDSLLDDTYSKACFSGTNSKRKSNTILSTANSSSLHLKQTKTICSNSKQNDSNSCNKSNSNKSINGTTKCSLHSTSDSDSDFESFLKTQKRDMGFREKTSKHKKDSLSRKRKRKKSNLEALRYDSEDSSESLFEETSKRKRKISHSKKLKAVQFDSEDNELLSKETNSKRSNSKISSRVSSTNRLLLPETSESSLDEAKDIYGGIDETQFMPVVESDSNNRKSSKQINTIDCTVRIEPIENLDKMVTQLITPLKDNCSVQNSECYSEHHCNETENADGWQREIVLGSVTPLKDICNVQNSESYSENHYNETENADGWQREIVLDSDDDCVVICEVSKSNKHTNETGLDQRKDEDIQISKVESLAQSDQHTEHIVLKNTSEIIETANKLDFKEIIISLSNIENTMFNDKKVSNPLPCTSSSTDNPRASKLESSDIQIIDENHWQNLQNVCEKSYELPEDPSSNLTILKSANSTNFKSNVETSSREMSDDVNLDQHSLKKIPLNANQCLNSNETTFQEENTYRLNFNTDNLENPVDDLDSLANTSIQDLCRNSNPQNFLKFLSVFREVCQNYDNIKDSEESTGSEAIIKESLANSKKYMETALRKLTNSDPCFYKTFSDHERIVAYNSMVQHPENYEAASYDQIGKCARCEKKAKIECARCHKTAYCSEECGIQFWELGHYKVCEGLQR